MPTQNLGALDAATDPVATGSTTFSVAVSGTFVGTVLFERRVSPSSHWETMARDSAGTAFSFTAPSGGVLMWATEQEPEAQVRARMSAYTSGTATVRIGR